MILKNASVVFFGLQDDELGEVVILSCFDVAQSIKRAYRGAVINEFSRYYKGFTLAFSDKKVSFIVTGPGASRVGDVVMALKATSCRAVLYLGAAGGIGRNVCIGDIFIPLRAVSGEGFSHYYQLPEADISFKLASIATEALVGQFVDYCRDASVFYSAVHCGTIFTIGSVFAETKSFLMRLKQQGVAAIDMETSAFYTAACQAGLACMAVHYISDLAYEESEINIFNTQCRKLYVKLPREIMEFVKNDLLLKSCQKLGI